MSDRKIIAGLEEAARHARGEPAVGPGDTFPVLAVGGGIGRDGRFRLVIEGRDPDPRRALRRIVRVLELHAEMLAEDER